MAGDYLPVAELFASLGLDSSSLTDGLAAAKLELRDLKPDVMSVTDALSLLQIQGRATAQQLAEVPIHLQRAWQNQHELTQARKNDMAAEREHAAEIKANLAAEFAIKKEYAQLTKQFRDQELAQEKALVAEESAARSRYGRTVSILLRQQEEAQKAVNDTTARQIALSEMGVRMAMVQAEAQTALGGAARRTGQTTYESQRLAGLEMMAANKILGVDMPWSLTRLMATVPQVSAAMSAMFDVVMVGVFLDMLYQVGSKIWDLTEAMNGFDAASIKAWDSARSDNLSDRARALKDDLLNIDIKYEQNKKDPRRQDKAQWDELRDIEKTKHIEEARAIAIERILSIRKSLKALDDAENNRSGQTAASALYNPTGFIMGHLQPAEMAARQKLYEQGTSEEKQRAALKAEVSALEALDLEKKQMAYSITKDETRELEKQVRMKRSAKERDEVHELPYRLPWFMGVDPASAFANQMYGLQTGGINPSQAGTQSIRPVNMPSVSRRATAENPVTGQASGGSSGRDIILQVTYAPVFQVENMGDVEAVMRDKIEPKFIEDMKNNTRGLRAEIIAALKRGQ